MEAQATRCQLLTGSYANATRSCTCKTPSECVLTVEQRELLRNHPNVVAAIARNTEEFNNV